MTRWLVGVATILGLCASELQAQIAGTYTGQTVLAGQKLPLRAELIIPRGATDRFEGEWSFWHFVNSTDTTTAKISFQIVGTFNARKNEVRWRLRDRNELVRLPSGYDVSLKEEVATFDPQRQWITDHNRLTYSNVDSKEVGFVERNLSDVRRRAIVGRVVAAPAPIAAIESGHAPQAGGTSATTAEPTDDFLVVRGKDFAVFFEDPAGRRCHELFTVVLLRMDVPKDVPILNNEEYWQRADSVIFPAVRRRCPSATDLIIRNYFANYHFGRDGKLIRDFKPGDDEVPVSQGYLKQGGAASGSRHSFGNGLMISGDNALRVALSRDENRSAEAIIRTVEGAPAARARAIADSIAEYQRQIAYERRETAPQLALYSPTRARAGRPLATAGLRNKALVDSIVAGDAWLTWERVGPDRDRPTIASILAAVFDEDVHRLAAYQSWFVIYQLRHSRLCRTDKRVPWTTLATPNNSETYEIREPYSDFFLIAFNAQFRSRSESIGSAIANSQVTGDVDALISQAGCLSPTLTQFEVNLFLAARHARPVQILKP